MKQETGVGLSIGFPPVSRRDARVLILGSLPGQRSLRAAQYYAHPQNAFWRIMRELTGAAGDYEQRCAVLLDHRIALWDVLAESVRPGSMDADIQLKTAELNDFKGFFSEHHKIDRIFFNGHKAAQLFRRYSVPDAAEVSMQFATLPSTSPAYASMPFSEKLAMWRRVTSG
jgi:hypoxanthine-DNA glycosylase